jgi:predicted PurR-regulated permease PerM
MTEPVPNSTPAPSLVPPGTRAWWASLGVLTLGIAIAVSALILIALFIRPLSLFFLSVCIAAALTPLVQRLSHSMPRGRAILLIYGGLILLLVLILAALVPPLANQVTGFIENLPQLAEQGRQFLERNGIDVATLEFEGLAGQIGAVGGRLVTVPFSAFSGLLDALLVLIVSLYLLIDAAKIQNFIFYLFRRADRERVATVGREVIQVAGGYVRGVVINVIVVSVITTIGTGLIGLPFALGLGIFAGLLEALPVIGSLIAAIPILVIAFFQSPTTGLLALAFIGVLQVVQGNIISPAVMKSQASVPEYIAPLAVLAGGAVGGILGALIAVPLVAVIRVLVLRVLVPFARVWTGAAAEDATVVAEATA